MDAHSKLRAQIRAGRELLGLKQADVAEMLDTSLSRVSRAESGETKSGDTLLEIKAGLERAGMRFTQSGVEIVENRLEVIEGEGCYARLLAHVSSVLQKEENKELLIMFASDKSSPTDINDLYRVMRKSGIKMRQLIEESDTYIMGELEEYRTIPSRYFLNIVTLVYGDNVAQVGSAEARITIYHDAHLAEREKRIFSYFWDHGKKPERTDAKGNFNS